MNIEQIDRFSTALVIMPASPHGLRRAPLASLLAQAYDYATWLSDSWVFGGITLGTYVTYFSRFFFFKEILRKNWHSLDSNFQNKIEGSIDTNEHWAAWREVSIHSKGQKRTLRSYSPRKLSFSFSINRELTSPFSPSCHIPQSSPHHTLTTAVPQYRYSEPITYFANK